VPALGRGHAWRPRAVCVLAVPTGLAGPKAGLWAWQARLGPISPVVVGGSAAQVNSDVFLFLLD
jgi:hypothetical protein